MWHSVLGKEERWNIMLKCTCFLNSFPETQCSLYILKNRHVCVTLGVSLFQQEHGSSMLEGLVSTDHLQYPL